MFNNDMMFYLVSQKWNTTQCSNLIIIMKSIWNVLVIIMVNVVFSQFRISLHHLEIELTIYR